MGTTSTSSSRFADGGTVLSRSTSPSSRPFMRTLSEFRSSANDRAESADAEDWLGVMMQYVLCLGVALANLLVPCSLTILPLMPYLDRPKTGGIKLQRSGAQALSGYQLDEDVVNARPYLLILGIMSELVLHPYYLFFFLYLEPISALAGAVAALFPSIYLSFLDPSASESSLQTTSLAVSTAIAQLANLYLFFALTEALVLRAARHHAPSWRALISAMLIADFGHLLAAWRLGMRQYWSVSEWGWMELGGIGFVYAGAATRIMFLSGLGVKSVERRGRKGL